MLWMNAGPARLELERRAAAMLPPAGASLVAFIQAVRRLQDGDTRAPITAPARPDRRSLAFFAGLSQMSFDVIRGDVSGRPAPCRRPGRRVP